MKVTIKVYGRYRDIAGKETLQLDVVEGKTLWYVVDAFVKRFPAVSKDKNFMMMSKNNMYVGFDTLVNEGDEISLSPPVVSGG
jgi:molybdopterin converting factor small subunit